MAPEPQQSTDTYHLTLDQQIGNLNLSSSLPDDAPVSKPLKEELIEVHLRNVALLAAKSSIPCQQRPFILPAAYSPCTASLNDLQRISIGDLIAGAHHRGCFVTARTVTTAYVSTDLVTILEEEGGNVTRLELCFQDPSSPYADLPENSTVAIKEPYYKYNGKGDFVIHVDHPSDIAVLRGDDPAVLMIIDVVSKTKDVTASEWRGAGDKAYLEKNYSSAIECYTQAIEGVEANLAFKRAVYRKRAFANLTAKRFHVAFEDALASCGCNVLDSMAQYCAGKAAYELEMYKESKDHFEKALETSPRDYKYRKDYNLAVARIAEQQNGTYDFKSMGEDLNENHMNLDHASFIRNTMVAATEKKGRGLFATRNIPRGNLVLCEKALGFPNMQPHGKESSHGVLYNFNTNTRTQSAAQGALFIQLIHKLYNNPTLTSRFFDLDSGDYIRSGKEGELVDGVPIIDVFLIEAIRLKNSFAYQESGLRQDERIKGQKSTGKGDLQTGLWTRAAYINHSCIPNCARSFIGNIMILRATCEIPIGTEITHQYTAPAASHISRQDHFRGNWQFECECNLCAGERKSLDTMHKQRRNLVYKIQAEATNASRSGRVPEATIRNVERMLKLLEGLYEAEIYDTLPRLFLVHPTIWLTEVNRSKRNFAKTAKYAMEILRNFGFIDPVKDGKLSLDYAAGIVNSESFNALQYAMDAYRELGKLDLSEQCESEAREIFAIITGDNEGIEEALKGKEQLA